MRGSKLTYELHYWKKPLLNKNKFTHPPPDFALFSACVRKFCHHTLVPEMRKCVDRKAFLLYPILKSSPYTHTSSPQCLLSCEHFLDFCYLPFYFLSPSSSSESYILLFSFSVSPVLQLFTSHSSREAVSNRYPDCF